MTDIQLRNTSNRNWKEEINIILTKQQPSKKTTLNTTISHNKKQNKAESQKTETAQLARKIIWLQKIN